MQIPKLITLKRRFFEWLPENNRLERIWKLAQVDFRRRYYGNSLGLVWALLNPLFRVGIYYMVFTFLLNSRMENYALYLFSGLLFWMFFTEGTNKGLTILNQKRYLIENIQFNKLDLFYSAIFSVLLGFLFNLVAYLLISFASGISFYKTIIFLPILIANIFLLALAVSILLATLNIYIKDIAHIWAIAILAGFWATPIFLPVEAFDGKMQFLLYANPVASIIINAREILLYGNLPNMTFLIWGISYALILFGIAVFLFKKFSHKAAEKI